MDQKKEVGFVLHLRIIRVNLNMLKYYSSNLNIIGELMLYMYILHYNLRRDNSMLIHMRLSVFR